jgi:hypothetical protein
MPAVPSGLCAIGARTRAPILDELWPQSGRKQSPHRELCGQDSQARKTRHLPIERPTKVKMVINLKAARTLGLEVATSLL